MSLAVANNHNTESVKGQSMMPQGSQLAAEMALVGAIALSAVADVGVRTETATPDQLLILWCVIGGCVGAFCSLQFFAVKTRGEAMMQMIVNLGLSSMVSPLVVDLASSWTGYPVGLRLSLPIACAIGLLGQQIVTLLIPLGRQWLTRKAKDVTGTSDG